MKVPKARFLYLDRLKIMTKVLISSLIALYEYILITKILADSILILANILAIIKI